MLISLHLVLSKYIKMNKQKISPIDRYALELFCVAMYTNFLSNLYRKFQVAFTYDTNVEYRN